MPVIMLTLFLDARGAGEEVDQLQPQPQTAPPRAQHDSAASTSSSTCLATLRLVSSSSHDSLVKQLSRVLYPADLDSALLQVQGAIVSVEDVVQVLVRYAASTTCESSEAAERDMVELFGSEFDPGPPCQASLTVRTHSLRSASTSLSQGRDLPSPAGHAAHTPSHPSHSPCPGPSAPHPHHNSSSLSTELQPRANAPSVEGSVTSARMQQRQADAMHVEEPEQAMPCMDADQGGDMHMDEPAATRTGDRTGTDTDSLMQGVQHETSRPQITARGEGSAAAQMRRRQLRQVHVDPGAPAANVEEEELQHASSPSDHSLAAEPSPSPSPWGQLLFPKMGPQVEEVIRSVTAAASRAFEQELAERQLELGMDLDQAPTHPAAASHPAPHAAPHPQPASPRRAVGGGGVGVQLFPCSKPQKQFSSTRLLHGTAPITQSVFTAIIREPGAAERALTDLFAFHRPLRPPRANASPRLHLTCKQHDVLYVLAGCSDVMYVMSRIVKQTRFALSEVYAIDKASLSTWFKNRRLDPKKAPQPAGAGAGATADSGRSMSPELCHPPPPQVQPNPQGSLDVGPEAAAQNPLPQQKQQQVVVVRCRSPSTTENLGGGAQPAAQHAAQAESAGEQGQHCAQASRGPGQVLGQGQARARQAHVLGRSLSQGQSLIQTLSQGQGQGQGQGGGQGLLRSLSQSQGSIADYVEKQRRVGGAEGPGQLSPQHQPQHSGRWFYDGPGLRLVQGEERLQGLRPNQGQEQGQYARGGQAQGEQQQQQRRRAGDCLPLADQADLVSERQQWQGRERLGPAQDKQQLLPHPSASRGQSLDGSWEPGSMHMAQGRGRGFSVSSDGLAAPMQRRGGRPSTSSSLDTAMDTGTSLSEPSPGPRQQQQQRLPWNPSLPFTRLLGSSEALPQVILSILIRSPGVADLDQDIGRLVECPHLVLLQPPSSSSVLDALLLDLSPRQHRALCALVGCADVQFNARNVMPAVGATVCEVYNIHPLAMSRWFEVYLREGRTSSSGGGSGGGAGGGGGGGYKRAAPEPQRGEHISKSPRRETGELGEAGEQCQQQQQQHVWQQQQPQQHGGALSPSSRYLQQQQQHVPHYPQQQQLQQQRAPQAPHQGQRLMHALHAASLQQQQLRSSAPASAAGPAAPAMNLNQAAGPQLRRELLVPSAPQHPKPDLRDLRELQQQDGSHFTFLPRASTGAVPGDAGAGQEPRISLALASAGAEHSQHSMLSVPVTTAVGGRGGAVVFMLGPAQPCGPQQQEHQQLHLHRQLTTSAAPHLQHQQQLQLQQALLLQQQQEQQQRQRLALVQEQGARDAQARGGAMQRMGTAAHLAGMLHRSLLLQPPQQQQQRSDAAGLCLNPGVSPSPATSLTPSPGGSPRQAQPGPAFPVDARSPAAGEEQQEAQQASMSADASPAAAAARPASPRPTEAGAGVGAGDARGSGPPSPAVREAGSTGSRRSHSPSIRAPESPGPRTSPRTRAREVDVTAAGGRDEAASRAAKEGAAPATLQAGAAAGPRDEADAAVALLVMSRANS